MAVRKRPYLPCLHAPATGPLFPFYVVIFRIEDIASKHYLMWLGGRGVVTVVPQGTVHLQTFAALPFIYLQIMASRKCQVNQLSLGLQRVQECKMKGMAFEQSIRDWYRDALKGGPQVGEYEVKKLRSSACSRQVIAISPLHIH